MVKTLVSFGCSWVYGDELLDPVLEGREATCSKQNEPYRLKNCFTGIIAEHYGLNHVNLAFPGGSHETMRYALYWLKQKSDIDLSTVFLFSGLTYTWRQSWFDSYHNYDFPWTAHANGSTLNKNNLNTEIFSNLQQNWIKVCLCDEWEKFNAQQTVELFDYTSLQFSIPVLQAQTFNTNPTIASKNICNFTLESLLNKTDLAQFGHPNEKGHIKIANRLINEIDQRKLIGC